MIGRCVAGALTLASWSLPSLASAGGFEVPDLGTIPLGRGSAFTARADSLAAYHYNPAGLSKLPGPNLLISANVVNLNTEFVRQGSGDMVVPPNNDGMAVPDPAVDPNTGDPFGSARNGRRFGPAPMVVFSWGDVGIKGLALAIGLVPASGFGGHSWESQGAQRYTIRKGSFTFLSVGGGVSYRVNRYFSIGANFLSGMFVAEFDTASRQGSTGNLMNEEHATDNNVRINVKDLFVPSANFGVLSQPLEWLELGLAARLPYTTKASGTMDYQGSEATPDARLTSAALVEIQQQFPTVLRSGLRFIHRRFDIEADFVWENWEAVDEIKAKFSNPDADFSPQDVLPTSRFDDPSLLYVDALDNGIVISPVVASNVPLNFRDTYSARLGSDIEAWPEHLTVRLGGWFQSSAYPKNRSTFSVRFPFDTQYAVTAGLTWHIRKIIDISAGYSHIFQPEVVVTDGILQANAFRDPETIVKLGNVVNNGRYRTNMNMFGLAVEAHFDPLLQRRKQRNNPPEPSP